MHGYLESVAVDLGQAVSIVELYDYPILEDFLEFLPAMFQAFCLRPNSFKTRDLSKIGTVFKDLISCPF